MSTLTRRLNGVMRDLTPKQRALLLFHQQIAEQEPDPRLIKDISPEEQQAMDRAYQRLFHVAQVSGSALGLAQFWVLEVERNLLALLWLLPLKQHIDALTDALQATGATVSITPLPEHFPWTCGEGMTLLYGNLGRDHWDDHPPDLPGLVEALRWSIAKSLGWRWTETLAWEQALRRFGEREFEGEDITHPFVRRTIA